MDKEKIISVMKRYELKYYLSKDQLAFFNSKIKDVIIEACPYYSLPHAWNEDELKIDSEVGVAINNSRYVKLSSEADETEEKAKSTNCRFHFSESLSEFTIKVGPKRAFIQKISLYY